MLLVMPTFAKALSVSSGKVSRNLPCGSGAKPKSCLIVAVSDPTCYSPTLIPTVHKPVLAPTVHNPTASATSVPTAGQECFGPSKCGANGFCVGFEGTRVYCYGSSSGCKWNSNDCRTDSDCTKYRTDQPLLQSSIALCTPSTIRSNAQSNIPSSIPSSTSPSIPSSILSNIPSNSRLKRYTTTSPKFTDGDDVTCPGTTWRASACQCDGKCTPVRRRCAVTMAPSGLPTPIPERQPRHDTSVHRIHSFHLSVFLPSCPRPSPPLLVLSSRLVHNSQGRVIRSLTCVQTRQLPGRKYSNVPVCTGSFDRTVASPIPSPAPTMTFAPTLAPTMAHPTLVRTHALMHARTRAHAHALQARTPVRSCTATHRIAAHLVLVPLFVTRAPLVSPCFVFTVRPSDRIPSPPFPS